MCVGCPWEPTITWTERARGLVTRWDGSWPVGMTGCISVACLPLLPPPSPLGLLHKVSVFGLLSSSVSHSPGPHSYLLKSVPKTNHLPTCFCHSSVFWWDLKTENGENMGPDTEEVLHRLHLLSIFCVSAISREDFGFLFSPWLSTHHQFPWSLLWSLHGEQKMRNRVESTK